MAAQAERVAGRGGEQRQCGHGGGGVRDDGAQGAGVYNGQHVEREHGAWSVKLGDGMFHFLDFTVFADGRWTLYI